MFPFYWGKHCCEVVWYQTTVLSTSWLWKAARIRRIAVLSGTLTWILATCGTTHLLLQVPDVLFIPFLMCLWTKSRIPTGSLEELLLLGWCCPSTSLCCPLLFKTISVKALGSPAVNDHWFLSCHYNAMLPKMHCHNFANREGCEQ